MSKILIFGDSFSCSFNDMCKEYVAWKKYEPKYFGQIISEKLNLEVLNFATGGYDNYTIFHSIIKNFNLIKDDDIVFIGWSDISRFRVVSKDNFWVSVSSNNYHDKNIDIDKNCLNKILLNRLNYKNLYIEELNDIIFNINNLIKSNNIIHWSWLNFYGKLNVIPFLQFDNIKMETNNVVADLHINEKSEIDYANYFIKFLK